MEVSICLHTTHTYDEGREYARVPRGELELNHRDPKRGEGAEERGRGQRGGRSEKGGIVGRRSL